MCNAKRKGFMSISSLVFRTFGSVGAFENVAVASPSAVDDGSRPRCTQSANDDFFSVI